MFLNGKRISISSITISDLLKERQINEKVVVVEVNEKIIPQAQYATTLLKDEDHIEVVSFVGGG